MTDYPFTADQLAWIDALESGEYKQGRGALKRRNQHLEDDPIFYCCLGVACEVLEPEAYTKHPDVPITLNGPKAAFRHGRNNHSVLPDHLTKRLKLHSATGTAQTDEHGHSLGYESLTTMNDSGKSFEHIAKCLRTRPEIYFVS